MNGAAAIRRILAPNPGPYTGPGTNTYVVSSAGSAVVVDPGPIIDAHLGAVKRAVAGLEIVGVAVTHTHPDHAPAANPLAAGWEVPALGFSAGPGFTPDVVVRDGDVIQVGDVGLTVVHTPGHTPDHICFSMGAVLFTGDHIMSGSTVIIDDLADYMRSLEKVRSLQPGLIEPGHGAPITDAVGAIDGYISHRQMRERQVLEAVASGATTSATLVTAIYPDIPEELRPAAEGQVRAQLAKLEAEGRVVWSVGKAGSDRTVRLSGEAGT